MKTVRTLSISRWCLMLGKSTIDLSNSPSTTTRAAGGGGPPVLELMRSPDKVPPLRTSAVLVLELPSAANGRNGSGDGSYNQCFFWP